MCDGRLCASNTRRPPLLLSPTSLRAWFEPKLTYGLAFACVDGCPDFSRPVVALNGMAVPVHDVPPGVIALAASRTHALPGYIIVEVDAIQADELANMVAAARKDWRRPGHVRWVIAVDRAGRAFDDERALRHAVARNPVVGMAMLNTQPVRPEP